MRKPTRDLKLCEVVQAPIRDGRGRGSFSSTVSRLLRLGYVPLGAPQYDGNTATLTLTKPPAPASSAKGPTTSPGQVRRTA